MAMLKNIFYIKGITVINMIQSRDAATEPHPKKKG